MLHDIQCIHTFGISVVADIIGGIEDGGDHTGLVLSVDQEMVESSIEVFGI
jgi:hypothetical protein